MRRMRKVENQVLLSLIVHILRFLLRMSDVRPSFAVAMNCLFVNQILSRIVRLSCWERFFLPWEFFEKLQIWRWNKVNAPILSVNSLLDNWSFAISRFDS